VSLNPEPGAGDADHRDEAGRGFLVPGGDPAKSFEAVEEALDQIPLLVELLVVAPLLLPLDARRDDRLHVALT